MSNNTSGVNKILYIKCIVVECSTNDGAESELEGLKLTVIDEPNCCVELIKTSSTTWKQKDNARIPVPSHVFSLIASSDCFGDLGHIHLDPSEWTARTPEQNRIPTGNNFKWVFEPAEDAPRLSISCEMYDYGSAHNKWMNWLRGDDADPSDMYILVQLLPDGEPVKGDMLKLCGDMFREIFVNTQKEEDIRAAIKAYEQAVACLRADDPRFRGFITDLGMRYYEAYVTLRQIADMDEAIIKWQEALAMTQDGHQDLPRKLSNLGCAFLHRFEHTGVFADISESIQLLQRAVHLTPDGHANLPARLNNLATSFTSRFEQTEDLADISESIKLLQHAVHLTPDGHPDLPSWLNNLGISFLSHSERTGDLAGISKSIQLQQRAVHLTPGGHADLSARLNDLGNAFLSRSKRTGDLADISESIQLRQRAVNLSPDGHAHLPIWLNNLGNSFLCRFEQTGDLADISEAIQLQQYAVQLTPDGHADLPMKLNNLGGSFCHRFERTGDLADISEAIQLQQHAVQLTPDRHAYLPAMLNGLGISFLRRFERTGDLADVSKAIEFQQHAVQRTPDGHADLPIRLNNLGGSFCHRFERTGDLADISKSIQLQQRAVHLTPDGHADLPAWLNNLGNSFLSRFERTADLADISESIQLRQHAVHLTPDGHANLPVWLYNLGNSFLSHFEYTREPEPLISALSTFCLSAMSSSGSPSVWLLAAKKWARLSKTASPFSPSQLLDAHERIIHLLSLITGLENPLKRRHELLIDSSRLSTAAAAAALSVNHPDKALEWLEQGRCIVWNQINQLRTPVDDLRAYDPALADQFSDLSKQLEKVGSRTDPRHTKVMLSMNAKISLQEEVHNHLKLAKERDELLAKIRNIPGFDNFLQPRKCADLMCRLPEDGAVVIINADRERCDALILIAGCEEPMHIPLGRFSYERATILAKGLRNYLTSCHLRSRYSEEGTPDPRTLVSYKHPGSRDDLQKLLHTLWTDLVEPILQAFAPMVLNGTSSDLPRIWWCPTGPFAFLPIHAAGIYNQSKDSRGCCLADFAISSYTPTLSILDRLRSRTPNITDNGVLLVSQPDTPGLPRIPGTNQEVQRTHEELNKRGIRSALYKSEDATGDIVLESLKSYSSVHLACHASQGIENPLESAIHLYDRELKLSEIMKKDLPNADLAFMSACQTSAGDEKLPEEAVHLAAGMLAAGYRSVVATMWSISDQHAPHVAETFYKNLLSNGKNEGGAKLDGAGAARALHIATRRLREELGDSTEALLAWLPYIHVGI